MARICELTGKQIESDRLRVIPWTRFSAEAQRELENRGIVSRTQLGELGSFSTSTEAESTDDDAVLAGLEEKSAK